MKELLVSSPITRYDEVTVVGCAFLAPGNSGKFYSSRFSRQYGWTLLLLQTCLSLTRYELVLLQLLALRKQLFLVIAGGLPPGLAYLMQHHSRAIKLP